MYVPASLISPRWLGIVVAVVATLGVITVTFHVEQNLMKRDQREQ